MSKRKFQIGDLVTGNEKAPKHLRGNTMEVIDYHPGEAGGWAWSPRKGKYRLKKQGVRWPYFALAQHLDSGIVIEWE